MKYLKLYKIFLEGLDKPTGYLSRNTSHTTDKKGIQSQAQPEDIKKLRNILISKIKDNPKMYEFVFHSPKYIRDVRRKKISVAWEFDYAKPLKNLLNSLKDQYSIIGDNLESLYYEAKVEEVPNENDTGTTWKEHYDKWTDKKKVIYCEIEGHRIHFASGLPRYLRGTGLGEALYVSFIKFLGYGRSSGDASTPAQNVWKKLIKRNDFYAITTKSDVLCISKDIIGKKKPLNGNIDSEWLFNTRHLKNYTIDDVYTIIMKFMKIQNITAIYDMNIDPDLFKDFPELERKINNLFKYNRPLEQKIDFKDLLKLKTAYKKGRDYIKVVLENGDNYTLCVMNILKNWVDPDEPNTSPKNIVELSNEWMGDKYGYIIDIDNHTLTKLDLRRRELFSEPIKEIFYLGGKPK